MLRADNVYWNFFPSITHTKKKSIFIFNNSSNSQKKRNCKNTTMHCWEEKRKKERKKWTEKIAAGASIINKSIKKQKNLPEFCTSLRYVARAIFLFSVAPRSRSPSGPSMSTRVFQPKPSTIIISTYVNEVHTFFSKKKKWQRRQQKNCVSQPITRPVFVFSSTKIEIKKNKNNQKMQNSLTHLAHEARTSGNEDGFSLIQFLYGR